MTGLVVVVAAAAAGQGTMDQVCGFETETPPYLCSNI
jgi:hypothetical protein